MTIKGPPVNRRVIACTATEEETLKKAFLANKDTIPSESVGVTFYYKNDF
jgi:hypothetical protein